MMTTTLDSPHAPAQPLCFACEHGWHAVCARHANQPCPCVRCRVAAGIKFLDGSRLVPAYWRELIDLDTLDMSSAAQGILEQINRDLWALELTFEQAVALALEPDCEEDHDEVTCEWIRQLAPHRHDLQAVA